MSPNGVTTDSNGPSYAFQNINGTAEETKRLDEMHEGMKKYLGGALSFAPIEATPPRSILELGCGSGAWAIQAANFFSDAEVSAVDLTPLPPRPFPPNLKFQVLDLTNPFPFEPESFDIVHARFVFIHLPRFEDVLKRTIQLIKPGGWLLIDDVDTVARDRNELHPAQETFWDRFRSFQREKGANPTTGSSLLGLLQSSDLFREVNVKYVPIPITRVDGIDETHDEFEPFAAAFKTFLLRAMRAVVDESQAFHVPAEVVKTAEDEMQDPKHDLYFPMFFTWSRKRI